MACFWSAASVQTRFCVAINRVCSVDSAGGWIVSIIKYLFEKSTFKIDARPEFWVGLCSIIWNRGRLLLRLEDTQKNLSGPFSPRLYLFMANDPLAMTSQIHPCTPPSFPSLGPDCGETTPPCCQAASLMHVSVVQTAFFFFPPLPTSCNENIFNQVKRGKSQPLPKFFLSLSPVVVRRVVPEGVALHGPF